MPDGTRNEVIDSSARVIVQARSIGTVVLAGEKSEVRPNQLPAAQRVFVNRLDELRSLDSLTSAGGQTALIIGMPGVGKSALCVRWATDHGDAFPDGVLYVDLSLLRRDGVVPVSDVVASLLRSLGVPPEDIPASFSDRVAQYRTQTSTTKVLVIVDNAMYATEVQPLVPTSPESSLVVTSRFGLAELVAAGALLVKVGPLAPQASQTLIRTIAGEVDDREVDNVIDRCQGLPLALSLVSANLKLGLTEPPHSSSTSPPDHVSSVFEAAVADLAPDLRTAFLMLATFPSAWFTTEMVAVTLDTDARQAHSLLNRLATSCLVNTAGPGCFVVHALLHDYSRTAAATHVTDTDLTVYADRLSTWLAASVTNADRALVPDRLRLVDDHYAPSDAGRTFISPAEAVTWLELMEATLVSVATMCHASGRHGSTMSIAEGLWPYFSERKTLTNWRVVTELAVDSARSTGHEPALARFLAQLSIVEANQGQHAKAKDLVCQAIGIAKSTGHEALIASVTEFAGSGALIAGHYEQAATFLRQSQETYALLHQDRALALQYYLLAKVHQEQGNFDAASKQLEQAAQLLHEDDPVTRAKVHYRWAQVLADAGEVDEASRVAAIASGIRDTLPVGVDTGDVLSLQARIATARGDNQQARRFLTRAIDIYDSIGSPRASALRSNLVVTH